jgi:protein-S-isoprenylcysteine O-methyltransferase Ste14
MVVSHLILAAGWIIYCAVHSILAATSVKQYPHKWMGGHSKFYRLYYSIISFVGLIALLYLLISVSSPKIFIPTKASEIIGIGLSTIGAIIMIVCILKYFFQLSGLKSLVSERAADELMITGIHKYVRHPLYLGTFIFIWGLWIIFPFLSLFITNLIITVYTLIGIGFEEKKLEREFGEPYKQYKENTPMLIPNFKKLKVIG